MSSSVDFNYRKVGTKRKRVVEGNENSFQQPTAKRAKLELPTSTEWFHNYETLSKDAIGNPKVLSLSRQPLQVLSSNNTNIPSGASTAPVKLQPKSLELLERTKQLTDVKIPEKINVTPTQPEKKQKTTKSRTRKPLQVRNESTNSKKNTSKAKRKQPTKKVITAKPERTKEQELFPYEGLEIFDRIFVGGANVARDRDLMEQRSIRTIVNATKELQNFFEDEGIFSYFKIPLSDSIDSPLIKYFDDATAFMNEKLSENEANSLLVHCQMGQSRSPSVIIAYAMKYLGWSLERTWKHINEIHKDLKVNEGFKLQLMQYEKKLTGENSLDFYKKRISRKPERFATSARLMR